MATTPSGNPAWVRSNDHTNYGGHVNKKNYNDVPIVNPKTDVGAEHLTRIAADLAAVAKMADFAVLNITMGSGSDTPTVNQCRMMTGIYTGSGYTGTSPPTGYPSVVGVQNGVADITFASSYSDAYSVSGTFAPSFARAGLAVYGASASGTVAHAWPSGSDSVRVRVETASGSGVPNESVSVWVA